MMSNQVYNSFIYYLEVEENMLLIIYVNLKFTIIIYIESIQPFYLSEGLILCFLLSL